MFTHSPYAQTQACAEEYHVHDNEQNERKVRDDVLLLEECWSEEGNAVEQGDVHEGEEIAGCDVADICLTINLVDQKQRQSGGEDVDGDPADDLVCFEANRDHSVDEGHHAARHDSHQRSQPGTVPGQVGHHREECAGQHHPFHG